MNSTNETHGHNGECVHCRLDLDFPMPDKILDAAKSGDLVIFAGAGISTEVQSVFPQTIYETVADLVEADGDHSFPELMQAFQEKFNRSDLIKLIKKKFDYVDSFPNSRNAARIFHRELATMPYISNIVTTNWDTYFEEECAAVPFVTGEDVALYGIPGRKVIKIHGSISNLGSIVATEDDYKNSLDALSRNTMGGILRTLLSTKTVVFIGYSMRDWNFLQLYNALIEDMGQYAPEAYIVSPFSSAEIVESKLRVRAIETSGVKFLSVLKEQMSQECHYSDDGIYDIIDSMKYDLLEADEFAKTIMHKDHPSVISSWMYHDGALDACFRVGHLRKSGEYSNRHALEHKMISYQRLSELAESEGRYQDQSYIEGYLNVLLLISVDGEGREEAYRSMPRYFIPESDDELMNGDDLVRALEKVRNEAPDVHAYFKKMSDKVPAELVLEHSRMIHGAPPGFTARQ